MCEDPAAKILDEIMAAIKDLTELFKALSSRDLPSAEQVATRIISVERERGHASAAGVLKAALNGKYLVGSRAPEPISGVLRDTSFLSSALSQRRESVRLSDIMLTSSAASLVREIIKETQHRELLDSKGIRRRSKLIFIGPPGCGKTITAQAIAGELNLPLYVVRFDAVIGAYLGQTASHLRELFQFAATTPCVLLFDEVDALGKQRGRSIDVGELDRIVIAMMQELEFFSSPGFLIATSNLPNSIDRALWRRFDEVIRFPTPKAKDLQQYARKAAKRYGIPLDRALLSKVRGSDSYAEAERRVESEARKTVLKEL